MIKRLVIFAPRIKHVRVGDKFFFEGTVIDKIVEEVPGRFQIIGEDGKHLGVVVATNYYVVYF